MKRKPGTLVQLEVAVIAAALSLATQGHPEFYGFLLAKEMKAQADARFRTAYGTLYKTLDRMQRAGWLASRWEDPEIAEREGRPRRRLYVLTGEGERAYRSAIQPQSAARLAETGGVS
jgi:DNA-binding PadR family transcriptional regulator